MGLEDFVVVTRSAAVALRPDEVLQDVLVGLLDDLVARLQHAGCRSIGHIKGYINAPDVDPWFFSVTGFRHAARIVGEECRGPRALSLHINVIVEGVDEARIVGAFDEALVTYFGVREVSGHLRDHRGCS